MALTHPRRLAIAAAAAILLIGTVGWFWVSSLVPNTRSVLDMGYADYGGGSTGGAQIGAAHDHGVPGSSTASAQGSRPVDSLTIGTDAAARQLITLTARKQTFALAGGRTVAGYTINGTSPGPVIRAVQGELIEVHLINESVPDGITLHWHGVDVPNADDGVAGVTQDAVPIGGEFVYRFRLDQVGTYWYHSHQVSHEQVIGGLLGAIVVLSPVAPAAGQAAADPLDQLALVHIYDGRRTINGLDGDSTVQVPAGRPVRVRVINTDNGPMSVWVNGSAYRLLAVDGTEVNQPTPISDQSVQVTAGGRADLEVVTPSDGSAVRVEMGGSASLTLSGGGATPAPSGGQPSATLDLLGYGSPAPLGFDPGTADRAFEYAIGRRPGFLDGVPGLWWTINGHLYPDVPMFMVAEGDLVRMQISNDSGEVHPMHLHGHHAVVLSRNGVAVTGSPWWTDSLNVADGESYEIAFRADNPGIWMDHCHNLPHASEGLVAHLMYEGVTEPFLVGGPSDNEPE